MKAFVFARPSSPRVLGQEFGHVGWGIQVDKENYYIGAVENLRGLPISDPDKMNYWAETTKDPFTKFSIGPFDLNTRYDLYKEFTVEKPDLKSALAAIEEVKEKYYNVASQNCMHSSYDILSAFGATNLPDPRLNENIAPIFWFNKIGVESKVLLQSNQKIDIAIYEHPQMEGSVKRFIGEDNISITDCSEEVVGFSISSIVVKNGIIKAYTSKNFKGELLVIEGKNFKKYLDEFDNEINSIQLLASSSSLSKNSITDNKDIKFNKSLYQEVIQL